MAVGAAAVVEKPLCTTLDDADRLVRVVEAGGMLTYAENLLFAEPVSRALTRDRHRWGRCTHLTARAMQPRPTWGDFTKRHWGGGVLFDLGVHPLALVLRAAGAPGPSGSGPRSTPATTSRSRTGPASQLRFDTGLTAQIEVSWRETDPVWDLQAASDSGVVRARAAARGRARTQRRTHRPAAPARRLDHPPQLDQFGYVEQLRDAEAAWRDGGPRTISDVYLGRDILEIVCAASLSARSGTRDPTPLRRPAGPDADRALATPRPDRLGRRMLGTRRGAGSVALA